MRLRFFLPKFIFDKNFKNIYSYKDLIDKNAKVTVLYGK